MVKPRFKAVWRLSEFRFHRAGIGDRWVELKSMLTFASNPSIQARQMRGIPQIWVGISIPHTHLLTRICTCWAGNHTVSSWWRRDEFSGWWRRDGFSGNRRRDRFSGGRGRDGSSGGRGWDGFSCWRGSTTATTSDRFYYTRASELVTFSCTNRAHL